MYSYKRDKIIQDDVIPKKSFKETFKEKWNRFSRAIFNCCSSLKNNIITWYKSVDWEQAGHKTADVIIEIQDTLTINIKKIIKNFSFLLFLFLVVQAVLFLSKWVLPLTPWFAWGWNDKFLNSLPYILHPYGDPWACILINAGVFFLMRYTFDRYDFTDINFKNIISVILISICFYGLFVIPEQVVYYSKPTVAVGIVLFIIYGFLHAIFNILYTALCMIIGIDIIEHLKIFLEECFHIRISNPYRHNRCSSYKEYDNCDEDSGYSNYDDYEDYDDYSYRNNYKHYDDYKETKSQDYYSSTYSNPSSYSNHSNQSQNETQSHNYNTYSNQSQYEPQKTYKYIRVRQLIQNSTCAEYWEFIDGKKGSQGGTRSYQGNLMSWSETMVTTDYNGFVRTYDVKGHVISQYKK